MSMITGIDGKHVSSSSIPLGPSILKKKNTESSSIPKIRIYDFIRIGGRGEREIITGPSSLTKTAKFREKETTLERSMVGKRWEFRLADGKIGF